MQTTRNRFLSKGVNLLRESAVETLEELSIKKTVYVLTAVGSLVLVFVSVVVLIVSLSLNNRAKDLKNLEVKWTENIKEYSDVEGYNLTVAKKMESVKKIKDTADFYQIFSSLVKVLPESMNISLLSVDQEGQLMLDGDSSDSVSLLTFFDGLISQDKDRLKNVILKNLILSKDGKYRFSLQAKFFKNR